MTKETRTAVPAAKGGWIHIIILLLAALYFAVIFAVYLYVGSVTGMVGVVLEKGVVWTVLPPFIAALFAIGGIYETVSRRRSFRGQPLRIVWCVITAAVVGFYLVWGATHGNVGQVSPQSFSGSPDSIAAPLLGTICPKEDAQVQAELQRAGSGFSHADSHALYRRSDAAQCTVVQQSLSDEFGDTGIAPTLFYYTTSLYTSIVCPELTEAFANEWLSLHGADGDVTDGEIDGVHYQYISAKTQYLLLWTGDAALTAEYSGSADLMACLQAFAAAVK